MHPQSEKPSIELKEGISYEKYTNSQEEDIFLVVGHALIRDTGEKNFINAKPYLNLDNLPEKVKKANEKLVLKGERPVFSGVIKSGNLVPRGDYLMVMIPPKKDDLRASR